MIMNWNYRLLDRTEENGDYPLIELVEVHYEDDGSLMGYCAVSCIADHIEEMRQTFAWYALALDKPVLKSSDFLILKSTEEDDDRQAELAVAMIEEGRLIDTDGSLVRIEVSRELYEEFHNNVSGIGDDNE